IDEVLVVDISIDDVAFAGRRLDGWTPGQDSVALAINLAAAHGCVIGSSAFQKAPWGDVKLHGVGPRLRDIALLRRDLLEKDPGRYGSRAAGPDVVRGSCGS